MRGTRGAHLAPPEKAAADWLERNAKTGENIVEAEARENGDFSIYTRYAAATGIPTVVGPPAHTFYWAPADAPLGRGEDARKVKSAAESDEVSRRKANVRLIYSPIPAVQRARILNDYNVKWVMWGELERRRYGEPMWPDIATGPAPSPPSSARPTTRTASQSCRRTEADATRVHRCFKSERH